MHVVLGIPVLQVCEEVWVCGELTESSAQCGKILRCVVLHPVCLGYVLGCSTQMCIVALCQCHVFQCLVGIAHVIAAMSGKICCCRHQRVVFQIVVAAAEYWLVGAVNVCVEKVESRLIVVFSQEERAAEEQVRAVGVESLCVLAAVFHLYSLLCHLACRHRVETLKYREHLLGIVKEFRRVVFFPQIQFLVALRIELLHSLIPGHINFFVGAHLLTLIQQAGKCLDCIVKVLAAFHVDAGLRIVFFLLFCLC